MNMRRLSTLTISALLLLGPWGCKSKEAPKPAPVVSPFPRTTVIDTFGQGPGRVELVRFQPSAWDDLFEVRQGGKVVLESPGRVIGLVAAIPSREKPRFLLAELNHSGNKCPLWYRLIDLRGEVATANRDDFGTCWRLKGEPAELDGAVRAEFFSDRSGASVTAFVIKDGVVTKAPPAKAGPKTAVKAPAAPAR
jgi:hypothetical protein